MGQVWNDIFDAMMPKRVSFVESFDTFLADDFISEDVNIYDFEIDVDIDTSISLIKMKAMNNEMKSTSPMGQLLSERQEIGATYPLFDNNPLIPPPLRDNLQRVIFGPYFDMVSKLMLDGKYEGEGLDLAATTFRPKGLRHLYRGLINPQLKSYDQIRKARLFIDLVHTLVVEDMLKKIPGSGTSTDQEVLINTFCELAIQSYNTCYDKACEMVENK